jgi:hypothetical protein
VLRVFRVLCVATILICGVAARAQELTRRSPVPEVTAPQVVSLTLPAGTPLQVALDKEVRVHKAGQPIHGRIAQAVYAFDKLVIPVGTEAFGKIAEIKRPPASRRLRAASYGDFTPRRDLVIEFDELVLPDARRISIHTIVSPTSQGLLELTTVASKEKKQSKFRKAAADQFNATKNELELQWNAAKSLITKPDRLHRLERFGLSQLPFHPQFLDAGTRFYAELQEPLDFGQETRTPDQMAAIGALPTDDHIVHALLLTAVSSATAKKGDSVEAVITEPFYVDNRLILPQGTRLLGPVLETRPARKFQRNGELRISFREVVPPGGKSQRVQTGLEGVEAASDDGLKMDAEGGVHIATPKTKYVGTIISFALAAKSFDSDIRSGIDAKPGGTFAGRGANGGNGLRFIGSALCGIVRSRGLASGFSVYGAAVAFYDHFLARGQNIVFPKGTAMTIRIGTHASRPAVSPLPPDLPMPPVIRPLELPPQP